MADAESIRTAKIPGGDLEIAFGGTRMVIYNVRNRSAVSMNRTEWEYLVRQIRTARATALSIHNRPEFWFPPQVPNL